MLVCVGVWMEGRAKELTGRTGSPGLLENLTLSSIKKRVGHTTELSRKCKCALSSALKNTPHHHFKDSFQMVLCIFLFLRSSALNTMTALC